MDNHASQEDVRRQRSALKRAMLIAFPATVGIWLGVYYLLPPIAGMEDPVSRLLFAIKCSCVAILLCFLTGIEAVSHERLFSPAIDPLSGYETRRLKINLRYLQNTRGPEYANSALCLCPIWLRCGGTAWCYLSTLSVWLHRNLSLLRDQTTSTVKPNLPSPAHALQGHNGPPNLDYETTPVCGNWPPIRELVNQLERRGMTQIADLLRTRFRV